MLERADEKLLGGLVMTRTDISDLTVSAHPHAFTQVEAGRTKPQPGLGCGRQQAVACLNRAAAWIAETVLENKLTQDCRM